MRRFFSDDADCASLQVNIDLDRGPVVRLSDVGFRWNSTAPPVLEIASFTVEAGEQVFVEGPSGSGKSTLLSLLAGVIIPQSGNVSVLQRPLEQMSSAMRDRFRADHVGFIFQMFNLIPYLSIVDNVVLPCRFSLLRQCRALRRSQSLEDEALRLLAHLDLNHPDLLSRPVTELSVGQQQRVAAARALMGSPELIIADEPTSSLDADRREAFVRLLFSECAEAGSTLLFVSHDRSLEPLFHRTVLLTELNHARQGGT